MMATPAGSVIKVKCVVVVALRHCVVVTPEQLRGSTQMVRLAYSWSTAGLWLKPDETFATRLQSRVRN